MTSDLTEAEIRADVFDPKRVAWVMDEADLQRMLAQFGLSWAVVLDLETTGLDEHATTGGLSNGGVAARVSMASFTLPHSDDDDDPVTWLIPLSHPESPWSGRWRNTLGRIARELSSARSRIIGQNIKFDVRWIYATTGVDLTSQMFWDTRVGSSLLDENNSTSLKDVVPRVFGVRRWDDFDLKTPGASERVPLFDLGMYAARDTYWTWRLAQHQQYRMFLDGGMPEYEDEIEDARLGQVASLVSMPALRMLGAMEQRGLVLDQEWVQERVEEFHTAYQGLFEELATLYPPEDSSEASTPRKPSFAPTSKWFMEWADRAVDAGDLEVTALTPQGNPQWNKAVLSRQSREGSEVAGKLLELRDRSKKLEFLRSWQAKVTPEGRIHTNYNLGSVVTGRLSSKSPNMQQVTRALRPAFIPSPGHYIADLDYSQIELRVAAFISECEPMLAAFKRGDDLHTLFAQRLSKVATLAEVTPEARQKAKSANFGLLYQMSPFGFWKYAEDVYGVLMSEEEAAEVHAAFFQMWDGISQWHFRTIRRAHATGKSVSPIGRVRRLERIHSSSPEWVEYSERAAVNSPVQGFASDLMQIAASSIEGTLPGSSAVPGARLVGTVHDSILVEVPIDRWEEVTRACMDRMIGAPETVERLGCLFDVPLAVEAQVGTRWGLSDVGTLN